MVCPKGSIGCTGMCRHNPQVLARQLLGLPSPKISSTKPQWQFIHESTHEWMGCPTQKDLIVYDDVEIFLIVVVKEQMFIQARKHLN